MSVDEREVVLLCIAWCVRTDCLSRQRTCIFLHWYRVRTHEQTLTTQIITHEVQYKVIFLPVHWAEHLRITDGAGWVQGGWAAESFLLRVVRLLFCLLSFCLFCKFIFTRCPCDVRRRSKWYRAAYRVGASYRSNLFSVAQDYARAAADVTAGGATGGHIDCRMAGLGLCPPRPSVSLSAFKIASWFLPAVWTEG